MPHPNDRVSTVDAEEVMRLRTVIAEQQDEIERLKGGIAEALHELTDPDIVAAIENAQNALMATWPPPPPQEEMNAEQARAETSISENDDSNPLYVPPPTDEGIEATGRMIRGQPPEIKEPQK